MKESEERGGRRKRGRGGEKNVTNLCELVSRGVPVDFSLKLIFGGRAMRKKKKKKKKGKKMKK